MSSIQDARTSERYMPRWEIWMGVFMHYAVSNVVNSLSSFSVRTQSEHGLMTSETIAAWDKLVGCVLILESHMMDLWRESSKGKKDTVFEDARKKFHKFLKDNEEPNHIQAMEEATEYYHQMLELLMRRGRLRFNLPRSFGRKHDQ